ncbi:receptor-like cytoplasmic kinase 176 [Cornus florida]|uniref:receptor-like cytoplasmic kinase 176 n=1 Tax=Cornus florida TaxID=4283 RepID=UPI0028992714|nr:receptor-like cytoplasmic kinase 176 [Cornus florida]
MVSSTLMCFCALTSNFIMLVGGSFNKENKNLEVWSPHMKAVKATLSSVSSICNISALNREVGNSVGEIGEPPLYVGFPLGFVPLQSHFGGNDYPSLQDFHYLRLDLRDLVRESFVEPVEQGVARALHFTGSTGSYPDSKFEPVVPTLQAVPGHLGRPGFHPTLPFNQIPATVFLRYVQFTPPMEDEILQSPNLKSFAISKLKRATKNFRSEGSSGLVFKGWIDKNTFRATKPGTGMVVAVERPNPPHSFHSSHQEWLAEINYLGQLSHPNIVKLVRYCLEDEHQLLVYDEFMFPGSLKNHLFSRASYVEPLSWNLRMKVALGAAKGLAYLHSPKARVIYRVFESSNILLDSLSISESTKVGPLDNEIHVIGYKPPEAAICTDDELAYASPEYVDTGRATTKSDIYNFGVALFEILTGGRAFDKNRPPGECRLVELVKPYLASKGKTVVRVMDARIEGQYSVDAALRAATIVKECLETKPMLRPNMDEVVKALEQLQEPHTT